MNTPEPAIADCDEPGCTNEPDVPLEPTVTCDCEVEAPGLDPSWLREQVELLLPLLPRPVERLAVRIIDDEAMTCLHSQFHDDQTTTDVLTFPSTLDPDAPLQVDIAICLDEARRQVESRGHGVAEELLLYVIHGLLHCCGHDDKKTGDSDRMHAEEDRLLEAIGIGRVYDRGDGGDA